MKKLLGVLAVAAIGLPLGACAEGEGTKSKPVAQAVREEQVVPVADIKLPPETARRPDNYAPQAPPPVNRFARFGVPPLSPSGARFIEGFEGFSSCPYFDGAGGVWTRGYGETEGIHSWSSCISRGFGEANLKFRAEHFYGWAIVSLGRHYSQNQIDSMYSFLWNLGAGIFTGSLRTALQHFNPFPMLAYDHAGGVVLAGLARRRRAEVQLFLRHEKPQKSPRQIFRERQARLHFEYSYRRHARSYLAYHHCRASASPPRYQHPHNYSQQLKCRVVESHGQQANKEISRLRRLGVR